MWKTIGEPDRPQMAIRRMLIACWITKATGTHSEHEKIIAIPHQQWLRERASLLRFIRTLPFLLLSRVIRILRIAY
jgi:hypothetical protein